MWGDIVYLAYVDESGDPGLVNSPTRFFVLTAIVMHELSWRPSLDELVEFRRQLKSRYKLKLRDEMHAGKWLQRSAEPHGIAKHDRLEILRRTADKLAQIPNLNLIGVVVDKQGKHSKYDVFESAWKALIQRIENTVVAKNFTTPAKRDDRWMLFPDQGATPTLDRLVRKMRKYNPVPSKIHPGTVYDSALKFVVEDTNPRDSARSYFIQAADLCAFLLYQRVAPSKYMRSKGGINYYKRLAAIQCKVVSPAGDGVVTL